MHLLAAAAATAKSVQSCPTLCDPIDGSPLVVAKLPGLIDTSFHSLPPPSHFLLLWVFVDFSLSPSYKDRKIAFRAQKDNLPISMSLT